MQDLPPRPFDNAKALSAFAGVCPQQRQSGTSVKGRTLVSKRGHADLRKALYMPGMVAIKHNPLIKDIAQRLKAEGIVPKAIISTAMHKLVHLIYGVLKTSQPFDANWTKKTTEVIETAVSVVVPVNIDTLALDFQDGICPRALPFAVYITLGLKMTFSHLYRPNSRFGGSILNSLRQRTNNMPSVKSDRVEKMDHIHWCILGLLLLNASSNIHAQEDVNVVELAMKSRGIEAHLKAMADEGNKTAPYMIDKETQYASAVAIGKQLTTQWVFIKRQKAEIDVGALK